MRPGKLDEAQIPAGAQDAIAFCQADSGGREIPHPKHHGDRIKTGVAVW